MNKRYALTRMEEIINGNNTGTTRVLPNPAVSVNACRN